jgi:putative membrane protein
MPDRLVAYCGPPPVPAELVGAWNLDPPLLAALGLFALAVGRRPSAAGWSCLGLMLLVFVSPLCALSAALFSARVVHHVILIALIAPLMVRAFPPRGPGPVPLALAFLVHTALVWIWHAPGPYAWALASVPGYWLMQVSLLASALAMWRAILCAPDRPVQALTVLLATVGQMGMLGALITLTPAPIYLLHLATTGPWGLTPLADQQLGGLIMWMPALLPYLGAALWIGWRLLADEGDAGAARR